MADSAGKTYSYCSALYAHFVDNAQNTIHEGQPIKVWSGFIGRSCRSLNIPRGMDNRIMRALEDMGCVTISQRGVSRWPSLLVLHFPPTEDLWSESDAAPLTRRASYARLISRVESLERAIGGGNVVSALSDLDARVKRLERQNHKGR